MATKVTPQAARAAIREHGGLRPAARALGIDCGFLHRISKRADADAISEAVEKSGPPKVANGKKTLADFRAAYDKSTIVPAKIRSAIAALGQNGWEYEVEFAKGAGVSLYDLGRVRDEFSDNIVTIGRNSKRAWAGSKALAAKMREML